MNKQDKIFFWVVCGVGGFLTGAGMTGTLVYLAVLLFLVIAIAGKDDLDKFKERLANPKYMVQVVAVLRYKNGSSTVSRTEYLDTPPAVGDLLTTSVLGRTMMGFFDKAPPIEYIAHNNLGTQIGLGDITLGDASDENKVINALRNEGW